MEIDKIFAQYTPLILTVITLIISIQRSRVKQADANVDTQNIVNRMVVYLQSELDTLKNSLDEHIEKIESLQNRIAELENTKIAFESELNVTKALLEETTKENVLLKQANIALERANEVLQKANEVLTNIATDLRKQLEDCLSPHKP